MYVVFLVIHTILVIFLIGLILIQRSDQDGMGLSGGGNQFLSGRAQANLLTRATSILAGLFILSSLALSVFGSHMNSGAIVEQLDQPKGITAPAKEGAGALPLDNPDRLKEAPAAPVEPTPAPAVPKPE